MVEQSVRNYINAYIREKSIARRTLAMQAGVSVATLNNFLNGNQTMNLGTLEKLVKVIGRQLVIK